MVTSQFPWEYDPDNKIKSSPNSTSFLARHKTLPDIRGIITFFQLREAEKEEFMLRIQHIMGDVIHPNTHPNIAKIQAHGIVEQGVERGNPYVVEEYTEGASLCETYSIRNKMPLSVALSLCRQMVSALQYMRARDIYHFGICSTNIIERKAESPAREPVFILTGWKFDQPVEETYLLADNPYLAPEIFEAATFGKPGERSDRYALAVVLYKVHTGKFP